MHFWNDLLFASRGLRKSPGLVAVVALSLGLGIGINTTLFNLFNLIVLAKPTAVEPERLVHIEPGNGNNISYPNFQDIAATRGFDGMLVTGGADLNWHVGDSIRHVVGLTVSNNFFEVLGNRPWLGRLFTAEENAPERNPDVAVLSYDFWLHRLQGDPQILGRTLNFNDHIFTVIGVLPRGYRSLAGGILLPEFFVPMAPSLGIGMEARGRHGFQLVGRLAPGVNRRQAQAAFTAAAGSLEQAFPSENRDFGKPAWLGAVYGLESLQGRQANPAMWVGLSVPFVIVGILLLIACANVAGVMLARGALRQREIAVRLALGATRRRVVETLLAESLLLSLLGAAGGLLLTAWLSPWFSRIPLPNGFTLPLFTLRLDGSLLLYTFAIALGTCLVCGLLPARQSTRAEILPWLKQSTTQGGRGRGRMRRILVAGQVAASVLMLMVCVLFLRSLYYVGTVNPGFDVDRGITVEVIPEHAFTPRLYAFAEDAVRRLSSIPGMQSVSYAGLIPLGGDSIGSGVAVEGRPGWQSPEIGLNNVGPRFFETLGIARLRGREFTPADRQGASPVVIVNQAFVKSCFPNGDALGRRIRLGLGDSEPWREIVGVVADSKYGFYAEDPKPQAYSPYLQRGGRLFLIGRAAGSPGSLLAAVTQTMADLDKTAITRVKTLRESTSQEFQLRRLATSLLALMGMLGLLLAMIGLYGVLSWEVSRRTGEIGIRMALGASRSAVRRMVLRDGLTLVAAGVAAGMSMAMLVTLPLRTFLAGVGTTDPIAIGGVAATLLLVGMAASWFPVRRATSVDPLTALRYE